MPAFTAFLDANVLYPAQLRNLLMYLAEMLLPNLVFTGPLRSRQAPVRFPNKVEQRHNHK